MRTVLLIFLFLSQTACNKNSTLKYNPNRGAETLVTEDYELIKPAGEIKGLLVLFGGFSERPVDIKREFPIEEMAKEKGIALVLMSFNRRLWLDETEKKQLKNTLSELISKNNITAKNIIIGGFSSGGNVSLLLANYLAKQKTVFQPKGVFIVDSPIDLLALYNCAKKNIERNFSDTSVRESKGIVALLEAELGNPKNGLKSYQEHSPYLYSEHNINNLEYLNTVELRMYTEPDIDWWKRCRQNDYEDMNAYYIKHLTEDLVAEHRYKKVELIETQNQGIRASGYRHPHSWSIVDKEKLLNWVLE